MAKKLTDTAAEEHSAKVAANIILQGEEKRTPTYTYQLEIISHYPIFLTDNQTPIKDIRTIQSHGPVNCSAGFFLFKRAENGNEVIIPTNQVVLLECVEMPTGKSKILGLDGVTPADAPKGIVS